MVRFLLPAVLCATLKEKRKAGIMWKNFNFKIKQVQHDILGIKVSILGLKGYLFSNLGLDLFHKMQLFHSKVWLFHYVDHHCRPSWAPTWCWAPRLLCYLCAALLSSVAQLHWSTSNNEWMKNRTNVRGKCTFWPSSSETAKDVSTKSRWQYRVQSISPKEINQPISQWASR